MKYEFSAHDLSCEKGEKLLFKGLSFSLHGGQALHINGKNGSGKTSLLNMLCGLSQPLKGVIKWQKKPITSDLRQFHSQMIHLGHQPAVDTRLSVEEDIFRSCLSYKTKTNVNLNGVLNELNLSNLRTDMTIKLSQGQRKRVALARLQFVKVKLWILDEPYSNLDGEGICLLNRWLINHLEEGGMAIFTSHQSQIMQDIAIKELCLS